MYCVLKNGEPLIVGHVRIEGTRDYCEAYVGRIRTSPTGKDNGYELAPLVPQLAPLPWHRPDRIEGKIRRYRTPLGELPSVTTILGATRSDRARAGLSAWKRRVGAQEAERVRRDSAARGTRIHTICEEQLTGWVPDPPPAEGVDPYWDSIRDTVEEVRSGCVRLVEGAVWHPLGFAGTMDWLAWWRGAWVVGDWKTSTKTKKPEWVRDYELQASAYAAAAAWTYREVVPRELLPASSVVAIAVRGKPAQIFEMGPEAIVEAWGEFKERVEMYYEKGGRR